MQRKTEPNTSDQVAANSKKTGHMARNKRNQYKDSATVEVKVHMQEKTQPKTSEKGTANSKQTGQTARNTRNYISAQWWGSKCCAHEREKTQSQ